MKIVDTHTHLFAEEFRNDLSLVVNRAKQRGVTKALLPNIDASTIDALKKTASAYPDFFLPMMGLHPTSVDASWQQQLELIYQELNSSEYTAIGEIGIDLYWSSEFKEAQTEVFETQLKWSKEKQLPVSIHSRNAISETVQSVKKIGKECLSGVFHSFDGTLDDLESIRQLTGFCIGINGIVTFKNSNVPDVLSQFDINRIVLETDAPYLAPTPYRGKRNESAYLFEIITKLAEIFRLSKEEIARITTQNACRIFNLDL